MEFLSTSPARGTTEFITNGGTKTNISIHVPREGDDRVNLQRMVPRSISIHVPREGDDRLVWDHWKEFNGISIHVPREGDDGGTGNTPTTGKISIHVPREGDDGRLPDGRRHI